jgi:hypothetical protein
VLLVMLTSRAHQIDVGAQMPRRRPSIWGRLYQRFRPVVLPKSAASSNP